MTTNVYAVVAVDMTIRQKMGLLTHRDDDVSPDTPLVKTFHYAIPDALIGVLDVGHLVWVPFGRERRQGIVVSFDDHTPVSQVKTIYKLAYDAPMLRPYQIDLAFWMSREYHAPLWDTLQLMLPPGVLQGTERWVQQVSDANGERGHPETRDERRAVAWLEAQGGEAPMRDFERLLGGKRRARRLIERLVDAGLVTFEVVERKPRVRPRHERFVILTVDPIRLQDQFRTLGRSSQKADVLEWLAAAPDQAIPLTELCQGAGCSRAAVRELADAGYVTLRKERRLVQLCRDLTDVEGELANAPKQTAIVKWLAEREEPRPVGSVLEAADTTMATLRRLEDKGIVERIRKPARVRLVISRRRIETLVMEWRGSETYWRVLDFLVRNPTEMTAAEVRRATGATTYHLTQLAEADLIRIEEREVFRNPLAERVFAPSDPPELTPEQQDAWTTLEDSIRAGRGEVFVLHGITGSGKTELYLRAVDAILAKEQQAIVLVPEIALTPQTVGRFGARFGSRVALQHSRLSAGERFDEWRRLRDGRADITIGSRSAIFAPISRPGLIIIDEEHEWTYKQDGIPGMQVPHYHARDVATQIAECTGATVILGSATPSLETYYRAQQGRYTLIRMRERVVAHATPRDHFRLPPYGDVIRRRANDIIRRCLRDARSYRRRDAERGRDGNAFAYSRHEEVPAEKREQLAGALPPVQIVDLRAELKAGNTSIFSRALQRAIGQALADDQQVMLFLNRRGTSTFVMCRDCGWVPACPRCDLPLTYHAGARRLSCHQCNYHASIPVVCTQCMSPRVKHFGVGTEQVEALTRERFPGARTLRWDRDTVSDSGAHERILHTFAAGQADILVGTQMIAKGLDLPLVTVVGVVTADTALHLPDFRAAERAFQLLTQVAGRAGRSMLGGRVIIQTYTPEHYAILAAAKHDYERFFDAEMGFRQEHTYPPVARLVKLTIAERQAEDAEQAARELGERLRLRLRQLGLAGTDVIGPAPAFFARLRGRYRWHLFIRGAEALTLLRETDIPFRWEIDVDPLDMLS